MSVIVTCNAGSTNVKLAAYHRDTLECSERVVMRNHDAATKNWLESMIQSGAAVIGHRVVHGGRKYVKPQLIDDTVIVDLEQLGALAPLHQQPALDLIKNIRMLHPEIAQVACFDTAFHHSMPELERRFPLPEWYHREGIQRYGFHGLSYQHIAQVLPDYAKDKADGRIIVAHLGGGSSAVAMKARQSVASTMGFSTLDGMMMGTRCGAIDPGVVIHLLKEFDMKIDEVDRLLYLESGLQGVSCLSGDIRTILSSDTPQAKLAIELYCYLAAKQMGSLLPAIGGLDAVVFTGGVGENQSSIREKIIHYLRWIGDFPVYIIPADEERVIANACAMYHAGRG